MLQHDQEPDDRERELLATSPEVERRAARRALAILIVTAIVAITYLGVSAWLQFGA